MSPEADGLIQCDQARCDFCGACVGVCASDAIVLLEAQWQVDRQRCVLCRHCLQVCPVAALEHVPVQGGRACA